MANRWGNNGNRQILYCMNHQGTFKKMKIMASSPITSWQIDGEKVEIVTDFIFLGSKITADGDCRHEIKRLLVLGRKVMTNLLLLLLSHFSGVRLCATP